MIVVPENIFSNLIKGILEAIHTDNKTADKEESILYGIFGGLAFDKLEYYNQAVNVFDQSKSKSRKIDVRMSFDTDYEKPPIVYITTGSDSHQYAGVGHLEKRVVKTKDDRTMPFVSCRFTAETNIVIVTDSMEELLIMYHVIRAMLLATVDTLSLSGIENAKFGGNDIMLDEELIPKNIFMRTISVSYEYEISIPSIIRSQGGFTTGIFVGDAPINSSNPTQIDELTTYNFCDQAVLDRLTPTQISCLVARFGVTCPDNEATVNSTPYATAPSGTPINVDVEDTTGTDVGSLVGGKWQIANATVENSNSTVSVSVEAEGSDVFPDTPIKANGDLVINQPSGVEKDVVVRYETQGVVPTTIVSGEVVVPDAPTFDNSEVWFNGLKVAELASGETWFQIVKVNGELPDSVEWDSPNANFNLIKAGGGATLTIGVFSDSGATIPITSADYGETIYIKATATATQENFTLFIDNGIQSLLPVVAIDSSTTHIFEYTINLTGTLDIYVIASDNTNGIADNEPFEFTVTGVYPPSITGNVLWVDGALESTYVLNGTFVQQLNDLSGLSNHLSAPTVGNQPLYLDIPNGINGMRSTKFTSGKYLEKLGFALDNVTGNSIYLVLKFDTSVVGGILLNGASTTDPTPYFFIQQNGLNVRSFVNTIGYSANVPIILGTNYLIEIHRTPTSEEFILNGVSKFTRVINDTGNRNNLYVNVGYGAYSLNASADRAIFNSSLSPTNKIDIRNYLMAKWNIV